MGKHHIKLPDHLYITLPDPEPPSSVLSSASSFFTSKAGSSYTSATFLFQSATTTTTHVFERHIPGFRTSAVFLTALRANLDPYIDIVDSPLNTPNSLRPVTIFNRAEQPPSSHLPHKMSTSHDTSIFAAPSALNLPNPSSSTSTSDPSAPSIPELTTFSAVDEDGRIQALRLIADSVAQQRQRANRALIFHPLTIGLLGLSLGLIQRYLHHGSNSDYALVGTTFAGILMTVLIGVRALTAAYIEEAERVGTWKWLGQGRGSSPGQGTLGKKVLGGPHDEVLVTKFGDEYIGTVVFRGVQPGTTVGDETTMTTTTGSPSSSAKKHSRKSSGAPPPPPPPRTEIRAWTVRQKFRGKGVGTALLEEMIELAHEKGWVQGGVEVAVDHANSKVVLPKVFSGFVQRNDERARRFVEKKLGEYEDSIRGGTGKGRKKR